MRTTSLQFNGLMHFSRALNCARQFDRFLKTSGLPIPAMKLEMIAIRGGKNGFCRSRQDFLICTTSEWD
jgi:hypothetical protein